MSDRRRNYSDEDEYDKRRAKRRRRSDSSDDSEDRRRRRKKHKDRKRDKDRDYDDYHRKSKRRRERSYSSSRSYSKERKHEKAKSKPIELKIEPGQVMQIENHDEIDEDQILAQVMGFSSFSTSKNKPHMHSSEEYVSKANRNKRQFRQYMNKKAATNYNENQDII